MSAEEDAIPRDGPFCKDHGRAWTNCYQCVACMVRWGRSRRSMPPPCPCPASAPAVTDATIILAAEGVSLQ